MTLNQDVTLPKEIADIQITAHRMFVGCNCDPDSLEAILETIRRAIATDSVEVSWQLNCQMADV